MISDRQHAISQAEQKAQSIQFRRRAGWARENPTVPFVLSWTATTIGLTWFLRYLRLMDPLSHTGFLTLILQ